MLGINNRRKKKFILFVCCGNRERSLIAERLLQQRLAEQFPSLTKKVLVGSAGIFPQAYLKHAEERGFELKPPLFGKKPNIYATRYLAQRGIDVTSYRSRELSQQLVSRAYLILALDHLIKEEVLRLWPSSSGKVFTLKEFVLGPGSDLDIGDPFKLPELDKETGAWVWPEGYPAKFIAEIEDCLERGMVKFVRFIEDIKSGGKDE